MTSSLFQEALADAKQLKEVAEQNAKNAIIDAVTPKIRKFIEDQLLEGAKRHDLEQQDEADEIDLTTDSQEPVDDAASPEGLAERVGLLRTMSKIVESLTPEESASLIPVVEKMRDATFNKSGTAGISRAAPSGVRSTHIVKENAAMQGKNKMYEVDLDELMSDEISAEDEGMHMGHAEDEGMDLEEEEVDDEMADLYESLSALFEENDKETEDDAPIEPADDEPADDEPADDEDEDDTGEDAGSAVSTSDSEEPSLSDIMSAIMALRAEVDDIRAGGGEAPPPAEEPMPAPEAAGAMPPGAAPSPSERIYKVDEAALLRELRALREGAMGFEKPAKKIKGALPEAADDEAMDLDETLEDEGEAAHESKMGKMPTHTKGHGAKISPPFSPMKGNAAKVMKENRDLKASLVKHTEAIDSLRGQLTEMNLFNAKLLYVNRLLQDRDLSDAQRRNIIESLDRARSLREVKLLYKGLSESIGRKPSAKKPELVSESVGSRAVSSTSRPLSTSGVRLNEAVEVHRWAVLAGIGSKS